MQILFLVIGLVVGFFLGYLFISNKIKQRLDAEVQQHPVTTELRKSAERIAIEVIQERNEKIKNISALATAQQQVVSMQEKLTSQMQEMQALKEQLNLEFQNLANKIFDEKSEKFVQHNKDQMDTVLNPFKEKLKDFEKKVEDVYKEENKERINLKAEIKMLSDMNKQLSTDANNLTTALKGSNKQQGDWGELILEKVLERSGLQRGVEYDVQLSTSNEDGVAHKA